MGTKNNYGVAVIGGGPIGLSTAYELAKAGHSVAVLEQYNFFNQVAAFFLALPILMLYRKRN